MRERTERFVCFCSNIEKRKKKRKESKFTEEKKKNMIERKYLNENINNKLELHLLNRMVIIISYSNDCFL